VPRVGQSRRTDVPHPDPLPIQGEGIGGTWELERYEGVRRKLFVVELDAESRKEIGIPFGKARQAFFSL
jgi:hypothetical protein